MLSWLDNVESWSKFIIGFMLIVEAAGIREPSYKRVCYFASWAQKRELASARVAINDIDPHLCTHLIYAFGYLRTDDLQVTRSEWDDVGNFDKFNNLKEINTRLKTLISIGGEKTGSNPFDVITETEESARTFARNVATFLYEMGFDGVDIDWEFPSDYMKFNLLLRELRKSLREAGVMIGRHYLLTVAVGVSREHIVNGYDIPEISRLVDFINLMTYGYHGSWDLFTGGNAPLRPRRQDKRFNERNNIEWTVQKWIQSGVPKRKLILGVAAQARSYTLANSSNIRVGAPSVGPGVSGKYTQEPGTLAYFELCEVLFAHKARTKWDKLQQFPFASYGNQWFSFDNKRSIALKAHYVINHQLGGAMIWSLDTDDAKGRFCGQGSFPLANVMKNVLDGKRSVLQTDREPADIGNSLHSKCFVTYTVAIVVVGISL